MKATSTLTRKTALEILIESRDKSIINDVARQEKLIRDIKKLKAAI